MIAVDTNVVLRYLLQDDANQSQKANALFEGKQKILITDVVLVETIWTLRGKRYLLPKETLVEVLHRLIEEPNVVFEDGHALWCALDDYINAKPIKCGGKTKQADFADALIVNKSQRYGIKNKESVSPLYTFNKAALVIDGTKEP
ncbi:PIN domain-containing protein [Photorhabdus luminescens]|uniref:PIN domain-containing protein n=1 Tax=Photorhabdus luminescens subsp. sonorensis TaxID=1173677 RepID=A0A5C4RD47_PHOLU|nr:type II toxin-antitoxin system VapC family toxin [Photorhabdus luminescens]TNH41788.1 PIN domain-containing protein [Photorhabdus luminescens subsp. sonorensis]